MGSRQKDKRTKLAHNVFFALKDASASKVEGLISACYTYLEPHDGILSFTAGSLVQEHQREVNVQDFQVSVHMIFVDKAAHDAYQVSASHQAFIDQSQENWAQVRVFDTYVV